ncbi:MAG: hypothetical protein LBR25_09460 [Erysipelotrichaceae bacterium]|jgi:hypothetical protein|nr:hypothetical protein [Erysipelotrichaceae bacterium]
MNNCSYIYGGENMKKTTTIRISSTFPASREAVFARLQEFKTLQYVAAPYMSFSPVSGNEEMVWEPGRSYQFKIRFFSTIPMGIHTILVKDFSAQDYTIYTNEKNRMVPIWNHRIELKEQQQQTAYSDIVEIGAGVLTGIVSWWAKHFYRHRQKKWLRLLRNQKGD